MRRFRSVLLRVLPACLALAGSAATCLAVTARSTASATSRAAAPAHAPAYELKDVLARHLAALGGADRLLALHTGHVQGTLVAGGLKGRTEGYFDYPRHERSEAFLSVMHTVQVLDGDTGWMLDPAGQLKSLEENERKSMLTERYLDSYRYLVGDPSEGTVELSTDASDSAQYVNLAVQAKGGDRAVLALDPNTWLPRKRVTTLPMGRLEIFLSDYRPVNGVPIAFRAMQVLGGDAAHGFTSTVEKFEVLPSLPDSLWQRPGEGSKKWSFPAGTRSLTLPVEILRRHIFVKLRINGSEPLSFVLDTGAGATTIDRARADALGLKSEGRLGAQGVGGSTDFAFAQVDSLDLGGLVFRGTRAVSLDLSAMKEAMDHPFDGILGYDVISLLPVTVDYAHGTLTLTDPAAWTPPSGVALPFELEHNLPVVHATYDSLVDGRFVVDTGNNGSLLIHGPAVRRYGMVERAKKKIESQVRGAGGVEEQYIVRGDSLVLGGIAVRRPLVSLSTATSGITGSDQISGNIGGEVLQKFVLTMDYPHHVMYLERGANFSKPMDADLAGCSVLRRNGRFEVVRVTADGAAEKAGVRQGDQVLSVDGKDVATMKLAELQAQLVRPVGTALALGLLRDGKPVTVKVVLKDPLE